MNTRTDELTYIPYIRRTLLECHQLKSNLMYIFLATLLSLIAITFASHKTLHMLIAISIFNNILHSLKIHHLTLFQIKNVTIEFPIIYACFTTIDYVTRLIVHIKRKDCVDFFTTINHHPQESNIRGYERQYYNIRVCTVIKPLCFTARIYVGPVKMLYKRTSKFL
jgi:hypothetical protein